VPQITDSELLGVPASLLCGALAELVVSAGALAELEVDGGSVGVLLGD
jgi:hypothetical protein